MQPSWQWESATWASGETVIGDLFLSLSSHKRSRDLKHTPSAPVYGVLPWAMLEEQRVAIEVPGVAHQKGTLLGANLG